MACLKTLKNQRLKKCSPYTAFLIDLLDPKNGEKILDLGCGAGNELRRVCELSRPKKVYGLDSNEAAVGTARQTLRRHIQLGRAELIAWDVSKSLPFPTRMFDAVYSSELLECLDEPQRKELLKEIYRVLKPGGRILMAHTDWDTQVWNSKDRSIERRLVHAFCDAQQKWMTHVEGWMGRKLREWVSGTRLFKGLKVTPYVLTECRYRPGDYGYDRSLDMKTVLSKGGHGISADAMRRFLDDLRYQEKKGRYFYSVNRYALSAVARR